MAAFLLRRLVHGVIVVALVATIVFLLIHAAPGAPFAEAMDNPNMTEAVRQKWLHAYGLDRPIGEQFIRYLLSVFRGDFGFSYSNPRPVVDVLAAAIPNTLLLMTLGLIGGFALGISVAVVQVRNRGKLIDKVLGGVSLAFFAVPDFWLALLILVSLSGWVHLFPTGGTVTVGEYDYLGPLGRLADRAKHLFLPALTLSLLYFPIIARHQRASLIDVLPSDYITTARAKGVDERTVIRHHAMRNALLPVVTILGVAFPALLTGAVFIERVFSWPGMGFVILSSINGRDYPLLTASVILGAAFVVLGSLLADTLYRWLDPRLR
jgi:peptide/nickel transport system permease protein